MLLKNLMYGARFEDSPKWKWFNRSYSIGRRALKCRVECMLKESCLLNYYKGLNTAITRA